MSDESTLQIRIDQNANRSDQQNYLHKISSPALGKFHPQNLIKCRVLDINKSGYSISNVPADRLPDWYSDLVVRIETLCKHSDGWKGPGSRAPDQKAKQYALKLLQNLALENISRRPSIGLDFEGTFSFSWLDEDLSADLTVYCDGTYSFFVSSKECSTSTEYSISKDEEPIEEPIHSCLLNALKS